MFAAMVAPVPRVLVEKLVHVRSCKSAKRLRMKLSPPKTLMNPLAAEMVSVSNVRNSEGENWAASSPVNATRLAFACSV